MAKKMNRLMIRAPKLSGFPLKIMATAVRIPIIGGIIVSHLKNDNGFSAVREWAAAIDDEPVYYPSEPPVAEQIARAEKANRHALSALTEPYASGATTPVDAARRAIAAIEASATASRPLTAFLAVDSDATLMQAAKASTARWKQGTP